MYHDNVPYIKQEMQYIPNLKLVRTVYNKILETWKKSGTSTWLIRFKIESDILATIRRIIWDFSYVSLLKSFCNYDTSKHSTASWPETSLHKWWIYI